MAVIQRKGDVVANGSLILQEGDMVLLYTKKGYRDMQILEV